MAAVVERMVPVLGSSIAVVGSGSWERAEGRWLYVDTWEAIEEIGVFEWCLLSARRIWGKA